MGEVGGLIGPAMSLAGSGGGKGGGGGGGGGQEGLTPQEAALLQYQMKQGFVKDAAKFGGQSGIGSGLGLSTMKTQAFAGTRTNAALEAEKMGGANRDALAQGALANAQTSGAAAGRLASGVGGQPSDAPSNQPGGGGDGGSNIDPNAFIG